MSFSLASNILTAAAIASSVAAWMAVSIRRASSLGRSALRTLLLASRRMFRIETLVCAGGGCYGTRFVSWVRDTMKTH